MREQSRGRRERDETADPCRARPNMVDDAPAPMTKVGRLAESRLEQKEDYGREASPSSRRGLFSIGVFISFCTLIPMIDGPEAESHSIDYVNGYRNWAQVAGYFDGDGLVYLNTSSTEVLQFALVWVDNCKEQLEQLRFFLISRGISTGRVNRRIGVFYLQIASPRCVLRACKLLLPYCFKKRTELHLVVDYYENKITGSQTIDGFNSVVRMGTRLGKIRTLRIPLKYDDAKREIAKRRGRRKSVTTEI